MSYDDADDEENVNADEWDSDSYSEKSEEEQWDEDHPNGTYSYEEAKQDDEIYETNTVEEWQEYRDEKSASEDLDSFPDIEDWRDEKDNEEDE